MKAFQAQQQRFEVKYLVDERTAAAIRGMLSEYLSLDDHCRDKPGLSYANHSIYLDTPSWQYYRDSIAEDPHRYKLRVRFYGDEPEEPVYLEIKKRAGDLITKKRAAMSGEAASAILRGQALDASRLPAECQEHAKTIQEYRSLMDADHAAPRLHLAYYREAWVDAAEPSMRFTMDRGICCAQHTSCDFSLDMKDPLMPWGDQVMATLKFEERFPEWFWHFQHRFRLQPGNCSKYAGSVLLLEKQPHPRAMDHPGAVAIMTNQLMQAC